MSLYEPRVELPRTASIGDRMDLFGLISLMVVIFATMYVLSSLSRIVRSVERIERHLDDASRHQTDENISGS